MPFKAHPMMMMSCPGEKKVVEFETLLLFGASVSSVSTSAWAMASVIEAVMLTILIAVVVVMVVEAMMVMMMVTVITAMLVMMMVVYVTAMVVMTAVVAFAAWAAAAASAATVTFLSNFGISAYNG